MTLGEYIRELRKGRRWTQERLSEESGVDQVTISHIETGRIKRTSIEKMQRLAEALGVRINELLTAAGIAEPEVPGEDSEEELRTMLQYLRSDAELMEQLRAIGGDNENVLRDIIDTMKVQLRAVLRERGNSDRVVRDSYSYDGSDERERAKVG